MSGGFRRSMALVAAYAAMAVSSAGMAPNMAQSIQLTGSSHHGGQQAPHGAADRHTARQRRLMLGGGLSNSAGSKNRSAFGWTNRHAQRVAMKKRNVKRHRAACR